MGVESTGIGQKPYGGISDPFLLHTDHSPDPPEPDAVCLYPGGAGGDDWAKLRLDVGLSFGGIEAG